ncbi:DEAD/DEAH box helicase family protein [Glaciihabitans sp. UYNi722]|uniref:DEAD/DEAH box helicase family protein n=1 Tax=Glaciihabitans sp. UYNi722 TaxID=3156344 RepID=UPI003394D45B
MSILRDVFPLAENLALRYIEDVPALRAGAPNALAEKVTTITAELLRWWFQDDYCDVRPLNFHDGQRDAILSIIYAHEVLGSTSLLDLYQKVALEAMLEGELLGEVSNVRNAHPKYAAKMATGTGKTWVLNALLVWQYLNHIANTDDGRFTSNFLVVAPGLIVYDRLLDSFQGKRRGGEQRDFQTSDIYSQRELFIPDTYRQQVFGFLQSSIVTKSDIGNKVTGSGIVAITNWHLLAGVEDPLFVDEDDTEAPGQEIDAAAAASSFVPLTPGTSTGNSLDVLDRRFRRGEALQWLVDLPHLLVFNDEAHHIHSLKKGQESSEVEWQKSLSEIALTKGRRFVQIDFSATPYNESGSGKNRGKKFFPHIVVDFDLKEAMSKGLVKALALDKRKEIAALANDDLDFRAERDDRGQVTGLSEGQRIMIRAGLTKLKMLEEQFEKQDGDKHPKLLIITENTNVSPHVEDFLRSTGLSDEDFLRVDSGKKALLGPKEWEPVRDKLFDIDHHKRPKVIVSVLMLREGFDVNNICVIVPLRSSQSGILLEQTIGRGLRLMWRGDEAIDELKRETRDRIRNRLEPTNDFDVLFIVEHPAFADFYEQELGDGLVGGVGDDDNRRSTGDVERVELRDGYQAYDFEIPFIIREADDGLATPRIDPRKLPPSKFPLVDLLRQIGTGDRFASHDAQTGTQYGDYRVDGGVMTATGYNDYLSRLTTRISKSISGSFTRSTPKYNQLTAYPVLQVHKPLLLGWVDSYIRTRLFGMPFSPLEGENWRVLLLEGVSEEIAGVFAPALVATLDSEQTSAAEVLYRSLSEVDWLSVRTSSAVEVKKCIYPKLPIPSHGGGLERLFIEWADSDSHVEALVKIHEYKHDFLRRPYLKADGMPAQYSPDFLVRTEFEIYVVETKAVSALSDENVKRKQRAALAWCEQLNLLDPEFRDGREWHYVLLGESIVREWHAKGERASALLNYARIRPKNALQQDMLI